MAEFGMRRRKKVCRFCENKIEYIEVVIEEIAEWMDDKNYSSIADFRGKMSKKNNEDPWAYTRAKYVKILQQSGKYIMK